MAAALCLFAGNASAQDPLPSKLRAIPKWEPGEKASFQVQQSVKERSGGKDETRFLSNGNLEIMAVEASAESVTFQWHRRMENAAMEMVREPWGIRGNAASEKLINSLIRDGLPVRVKLDLRTQRARIENREELMQSIRKSLQSVGGDFAGRHRTQTPGEQSNREPSKAQLGIYQGIARQDNNRVGFTPRSAGAIAAWYSRLVQTEVEDFLGAFGRDYVAEQVAGTVVSSAQTYRPASASEVLLTLSSAPAASTARDAPATDEDKEGEPAAVGLSGGALLPAAYEAKIEIAIPSGWPKRAAIVRVEAESNAADAKRTTQRRVYLRQNP
jgi:hypothetical protein